jgi:succinate dehydrogenase / fumarate reductase iron-sulfur subunit
VDTGMAQEANGTLMAHELAEAAFDAAACIGCGACVATCKNASASLFTSAKLNHLNMLPQGTPEAPRRLRAPVKQRNADGFGACSFTGACEVVCPQGIGLQRIVRMHGAYMKRQPVVKGKYG